MIQRHLISAVTALGLVSLAIHLWTILTPVVIFMKASDWLDEGPSISAKIRGYKINNCTVVERSFVGWQRTERGWDETPLIFIDDLTPDSTRPAEWQRQSFGRWSWGVSDKSNSVRVTMQHDCNGDLRTTVIGPFSYSQ